MKIDILPICFDGGSEQGGAQQRPVRATGNEAPAGSVTSQRAGVADPAPAIYKFGEIARTGQPEASNSGMRRENRNR